MERKESRIGNRRKGIGSACDNHVCLAGTNQVAGDGYRNCACCTGVCYIGDDSACFAGFGYLGGDCRNGHLGNLRNIATVLVVLFNRENAAYATADDHAYALVVVKVCKAGIGQCFFCGLDTKFGNSVFFFWCVDFV